jgi:hypothetical protein
MVRETLSQKYLTQKGLRNGSRCRPWVQNPALPQNPHLSAQNLFQLEWLGLTGWHFQKALLKRQTQLPFLHLPGIWTQYLKHCGKTAILKQWGQNLQKSRKMGSSCSLTVCLWASCKVRKVNPTSYISPQIQLPPTPPPPSVCVCCVALGVKSRASHMLGKCSIIEQHPQPNKSL